jgi:hypothetical protein
MEQFMRQTRRFSVQNSGGNPQKLHTHTDDHSNTQIHL